MDKKNLENSDITKLGFLDEFIRLRQRVAELEKAEVKRQEAVQALRESEQRYRSLFEGIGDGILVYDIDGYILDCNKVACQSLGFSREELLKKRIYDIDDSGLDKDGKPNLFQSLEKKEYEYEGLHITKNDIRIPVDIKTSLIDYEGKKAILAVARDIKKRKKMEEALRKSAKRYRTLFEGILEDSVFVHDMEGRILDCNEAACKRLGYSRKEILKLTTRDFDEPEFAEGFDDRLRQQLVLGRYTCEGVHLTKDGKRLYVDINSSVIEYRGEKAVLTVTRDITKRKKAEEDLKQSEERLKTALLELENAHRKLQELDQMKSDFISIVSHELRTPLTSIKNAATILLKGAIKRHNLDDREKEMLHIVLNNTDRQVRMITDLLDISKIEAGVLEMQQEEVDILALIKDVTNGLKYQFVNKEIKCTLLLPDGKLMVFADVEQIRRVLTNLIDNAVKFTAAQGEVIVKVQERSHDVVVSVSDNGIGISNQDIVKLFDKFYRSSNVKARQKKGTGLGLVITKGIIEAHGGKIWVEAELEKGSTFYFTLSKEMVHKQEAGASE